MAKDTEKLIRQLSLISYLMAERRPVTAPEIRRDVEGYSAMNEDAFARRFYADRSELEALRILLSVEKPVDGLVEQENYSLPPENFHLPPIEFTDEELAALGTALHLLDGEFAYAEPLRLALQQISWGRPSPLTRPMQRTVALGITGAAGGHEVSQRLAKIETAIFRRKTIVFDYYTMERDATGRPQGRPLPAAVPGRPVLRRRALARARRDPRLPPLADPRQGRLRDQGRARLPAPRRVRPARVCQPDRLAVRRAGRHRRDLDRRADRLADRAPLRPLRRDARRRGGGRPRVRHPVRQRPAADRLGARPRRARAHRRPAGARRRAARPGDARWSSGTPATPRSPATVDARARPHDRPADAPRTSDEPAKTVISRRDGAISPERFARLVTLASILIDAGRAGRPARRKGALPRSRSQTRNCARTSRYSTWSTSARARTCCTPRSAPTG